MRATLKEEQKSRGCSKKSAFQKRVSLSIVSMSRLASLPRTLFANRVSRLSLAGKERNRARRDRTMTFSPSAESLPRHAAALMRGLKEAVESCNDVTEEDLSSNKFIDLLVSGSHVGHVRPDFAEALLKHGKLEAADGYALFSKSEKGVVCFDSENRYASSEEKTRVVAEVFEKMRELSLIPGWRSEMFPVVSDDGDVCMNVERASASLLGIKAFGVHVNGYVNSNNSGNSESKVLLWVGTRSKDKQTFPGMLDHLSAGGLPAGMAPTICAVKELAEEAGVPEKYSEENVKSVSCVSYRMFYKECVKRDVLFCYDLELGESFVPKPVDGEVEAFELLPLERVCEIIAFEPGRFKPNCVLVIIDFAIRKGIVTCDMPGFSELVKALRR